jgi:hypothetical protein
LNAKNINYLGKHMLTSEQDTFVMRPVYIRNSDHDMANKNILKQATSLPAITRLVETDFNGCCKHYDY